MSTEHHGIFCYSLNLLFLIKYLQTWHYIEQAVTVFFIGSFKEYNTTIITQNTKKFVNTEFKKKKKLVGTLTIISTLL